ncbi:tRNA guanosine-2'-O-methyltransferase [Irpex rosettiformis]|uniref:tRNA guanosine-2'-O-methyltransferase n=1 Tax=Irpex rosettiformis TaxID=378272 RepID=A0ACB8TT50_9APHY|nr:tRNA guanosine-2'-O-methyltransferase [Irpex rosettiformis]
MTISSYIFVFAQVHEEFRIPELLSVSELYNISLTFPGGDSTYADVSTPFMIFGLECEEHAHILARRCILVKSIHELYATGKTYDEIHEQNKASKHLWEKYIQDTSFKFKVEAYNHSIPQRRQKEVVVAFSYMGWLGKIDMKNPEVTLYCFEEYRDKRGSSASLRHRHEGDGDFIQVYFGRLVAEGTARHLVKTFDVKKRSYYGNTSMEAEISLLMANQTLASPGKLIYDPFVGTGSMAHTTAHFGAFVYGSDIDGRQIRGKDNTPGIMRAASQYGVSERIIDLCTFDLTKNPWRCGNLFDAILTDPPYGVRAGAKRLGRKNESWRPTEKFLANRLEGEPYVPPTKPYELSALATDLVLYARYALKPGGRLVFFLPTVTEEYEELDLQTMLCEGMEVVANSLQNFGSWGRRLITIRKKTSQSFPPPTFDASARESLENAAASHTPAHKDFREKYFSGFKRDTPETSQPVS